MQANPAAYPDIQEMDIAKYLIHTVSAYTFDELRGRKSLEAYNYFVRMCELKFYMVAFVRVHGHVLLS